MTVTPPLSPANADASSTLAQEAGLGIPYVRKAKPRFVEPPMSNKKIWLISFTDLMGLMVSFFILCFSMTAPRVAEFKAVSESFTRETGTYKGPPLMMGNVDTISMPRVHYDQGLDAAYLAQVLEQKRTEVPAFKNLKSKLIGRNIDITLPLGDIINVKAVALGRDTRDAVAELARLLQTIPNQIELRVDPASTSVDDVTRALTQGQVVLAGLHNAGLRADMPILVNQDPDRKAGSGLLLTLRITRFRPMDLR